jgi:hypothetical protein
MGDQNHERKTQAAFLELEQSDIWPSNYNQPFYRLCRMIGFEVKPPHYATIFENVLVNGLPFGILWGAFMWIILWAYQPMPWWGAILSSIGAILLYGISMAAYFTYSHRRNGLTSWQDL